MFVPRTNTIYITSSTTAIIISSATVLISIFWSMSGTPCPTTTNLTAVAEAAALRMRWSRNGPFISHLHSKLVSPQRHHQLLHVQLIFDKHRAALLPPHGEAGAPPSARQIINAAVVAGQEAGEDSGRAAIQREASTLWPHAYRSSNRNQRNPMPRTHPHTHTPTDKRHVGSLHYKCCYKYYCRQ